MVKEYQNRIYITNNKGRIPIVKMEKLKIINILFAVLPCIIQLLLYNKLYGFSGSDILVDLMIIIIVIIEFAIAMILMRKTIFFKQAILSILIAIFLCICAFSYWNQYLENKWEEEQKVNRR